MREVISWYKHSADKVHRSTKSIGGNAVWREEAHDIPFSGLDRLTLCAVFGGGFCTTRGSAPQPCDVPAYRLEQRETIPKVAPRSRAASRSILGLGRRSSTISSSEPAAYPAQLQAALKEKLPQLRITLSVELQTSQRRGVDTTLV